MGGNPPSHEARVEGVQERESCYRAAGTTSFTEDLIFTNNKCPGVQLETCDTFVSEHTDFQVYFTTCLSLTHLNITEHFPIDCAFTSADDK